SPPTAAPRSATAPTSGRRGCRPGFPSCSRPRCGCFRWPLAPPPTRCPWPRADRAGASSIAPRRRISTPRRPTPRGSSAAASSSCRCPAPTAASTPRRSPAASRRCSRASSTAATDLGGVYTCDEVAALAGIARGRGLKVHMDGARFANALARLGCTPAALSWRAGIDILSFGATKNGGALCDAIVVFAPELADALAVQLRRAGQVWSKMRFASAQLIAYVEDGLWLSMAAAANAIAARIAAGLAGLPGLRLVAPVEANEIFLELPGAAMDALERDGFQFYRRSATLARFVCRFDATAEEADALVAALRRHCGAPARAAE